jgi:CHRD domain-containing protein
MHVRVKLAAAVGATAALAIAVTTAVAGDGNDVKTRLTGYEEVPVNSTVARGDFRAQLRVSDNEIHFRLRYSDLEGDVQQAHIHLGQRSVNGGIAVFLCSNLGNGPAGTQACPAPPATVEGTIRPSDIVGPAAQGLEMGEFDELVRAIRAGVTYANVHSSKFPNGEIRGQIENDSGDD